MQSTIAKEDRYLNPPALIHIGDIEVKYFIQLTNIYE